MKRIGYGVVKLWAYMQAILPFWLLYVKSDVVCFIVYHIVRYRRRVVRSNLLNSFPDKNEKEIKKIEKRFYRNLCDLVFEVCKILTQDSDRLAKRVTFKNSEVVQSLYDRNKSLFVALPHSGNWEWFGKLMHRFTQHKVSAIYKRVENPAFDAFMLDIRTNYHIDMEQMIESRTAFRELVKRKDYCNICFIVADQSPRGVESDYWTEFLHQDTCWFTGMERMAKSLDYAVVFVEMNRVGRGRYEVCFKQITDQPINTETGYITEQYARMIERFVNENPDNWLWSHRRWKHKRA